VADIFEKCYHGILPKHSDSIKVEVVRVDRWTITVTVATKSKGIVDHLDRFKAMATLTGSEVGFQL